MQLTKIAQFQRLITPKPKGVSPHKCRLNKATMLLLWCNTSPKSLGHCVMELQRLKAILFWWPYLRADIDLYTSAPGKRRPANDPILTYFYNTISLQLSKYHGISFYGWKRPGSGSKPLAIILLLQVASLALLTSDILLCVRLRGKYGTNHTYK